LALFEKLQSIQLSQWPTTYFGEYG
jgi:hypothetical protein